MARAINFILSAPGVVVVLLIGAIWIWLRRDSNAGRRFLIAAAVSYVLASTFAVPFGVSRWLNAGFHAFTPADIGPGHTAVVLMGSGAAVVDGRDQQVSVMLPVEAARVIEAARVFRLVAPDWIVSSGGKPNPDEIGDPSSTTMRDELVRFGVPSARILLESTSRDTHDEAVLVTPMLHQLGVTQIVIVTSETHMRRSLGAFRAEGWNPIPATAPMSTASMPWREWLFPSDSGISLSAEVVHELLGIPYYRARGWWRS